MLEVGETMFPNGKETQEFENRARVFWVQSALLNEINETKSLLGQEPRQELGRLAGLRFTDEQIAESLSKGKDSGVHAYSVNILRKLLNVSLPTRDNYERPKKDHVEVVNRIFKNKSMPLEGNDLIIFLTRYFIGKPMKKAFLARDFGIGIKEFDRMEAEMIEKIKVTLK